MPVLEEHVVTHEQNSCFYIKLNFNGLGHAIVMVITIAHFVHVNESVRIEAFELTPYSIEVVRDPLVATKNDIAEMVSVKVKNCFNATVLRVMVECNE